MRETNRNVFLIGTGLTSLSSLLLELALTRLFSVVLYYHFAFLAISLAMLGLGAGGVFSYLKRDWMEQWNTRALASTICMLNAGAILFALWVALTTPVLLHLGLENMLRLSSIYVAAGVPFVLTGILFSILFARETEHIALLYSADLAGASLACLAVVPLLNKLGGPNAVICAALAMALAGAIWADTGRRRNLSVSMVLLLVALIGANHSERLIDVVYAKGSLDGYVFDEFARWNAISRVEVSNRGGSEKWAAIDADANTLIVNADPQDPTVHSYVETRAPGSAIANLLRPKGKYAVIGPGGGIDILGAVIAGSPDVTGIEINPLIADTLLRGRYADYSRHLYELPQVHIRVSEGRSWIRDSHEKYDVIQMTLVDTWASTSAGAFALSENNLYTLEAFQEYFDHLKPGGLLAITRWEFPEPRETLRVVSEAIEALRRSGIEDVRQNFIIVAKGRLDEVGRQVTVLVKKTPFTIDEERAVLEQVENNPDLYPVYSPNVYGRPDQYPVCRKSESAGTGDCIDQTLARLSATRMLPARVAGPFQQLINLTTHKIVNGADINPREQFIRDYPFEIAPVTDNAPFFFFTLKMRRVLRTAFAGTGDVTTDWKNNLGLLILGMVLAISILAVSGLLVLPLAIERPAQKIPILPLVYFVAIGLGFMFVEVVLIQRFVLFLGHPTYAMTVVVFLLLLSSGAGSFASKQLLKGPQKLRLVLGAIVGLLTLYSIRLHGLLRIFIGVAFTYKVTLCAVLVAPLGFLMGMAFPTGLKEIAGLHATHSSRMKNQMIAWAWAVNAAAGVLGSVLALISALGFGLNVTLGTAAGTYFAAALLTFSWRKCLAVPDGVQQPKTLVCVDSPMAVRQL